MGIFYGISAAIFWGLGDFCARYATHRIGTYRTLCYLQFIGIFGLTVYLLLTGELQHVFAHASWQPWLWALLAALLNIASSLALYRAFQVGTLSLISPIAASYAVVTVILAFLSGEVLTGLQNLAIVLVLFGVIACSTPSTATGGKKRYLLTLPWRGASSRGIFLALLASLGYGLTFWLLGFLVTPGLGNITPVWFIRIVTPFVLLVCSPLLKQPLTFPRGNIWLLLLGAGFFDTLAYIAYTSGMQPGQVSLVTMLSSLYSAVTVLLAWLFLRERLRLTQWLGILVIFAGIVLVNL
ncbi:DMT family transporter [Dictyobacter formicarum]|uniref:EamA domain-containing protein n=1 Tax=Dictyobacter formicarum TaxID=2778368 RepID=A0ABQ3VKR7_9CHLR|nr:EamA family transporter [Dictyobacter formicarum]GHO86789.1 hypothetical protein KSZ_47950 [Dictyobacter formicarum]